MRDLKSAMACIHYDSSPVGAYEEFALIELSLRGPSAVEMPVTSEDSRQAGRALWGFPKELEAMIWNRKGARIEFQKESEKFRFRALRFSFPVKAKTWTNQILDGENVRVPVSIQGRARIAFRGKQIALFLESFEMQVFAPITL